MMRVITLVATAIAITLSATAALADTVQVTLEDGTVIEIDGVPRGAKLKAKIVSRSNHGPTPKNPPVVDVERFKNYALTMLKTHEGGGDDAVDILSIEKVRQVSAPGDINGTTWTIYEFDVTAVIGGQYTIKKTYRCGVSKGKVTSPLNLTVESMATGGIGQKKAVKTKKK